MHEQEMVENLLCVIRRAAAGSSIDERFAPTALYGLEGIARRKLEGLPERSWDDTTRLAYQQAGVRLPEWDLNNLDDVFSLVRQIEPIYRAAVQKGGNWSVAERLALQWYPAALTLQHCLYIHELGFGSDVVRSHLVPQLHTLATRLPEYEVHIGRRERTISRAANDVRSAQTAAETTRKLGAVSRQIELMEKRGQPKNVSQAVRLVAKELGLEPHQINALRRLWYTHAAKS